MNENKEQQDQQQQASSVDRVNQVYDNALRLRRAYKKVKGLRTAVNAFRAARAGATALQGAAATSPAWGTAAAIIILIILIISVFIIVFGGGDMAKSGAIENEVSYECPVDCQATACTGTDIPDTNATCSSAPTDVCCIPEPPPGIQPPIKFYCQYDDKWETSTCKINETGCTPTAVAMILASYGNLGINPLNTALANTKNGRVGAGCFSGSSAYDFIPWIKSMGYTVGPSLARGTAFDVVRAKEYIANGYYLLSGANILFNRNLNGGGGHAFVIGNIDSSNVATVHDPTFCSTDTNGSPRRVNVFGFGGNSGTPAQPLLSNSEGNYWFWVFPIKRL